MDKPRITAVRGFSEHGYLWIAQQWVKTSIHGPYPHGRYVDITGATFHKTPKAAIAQGSELVDV